MKKEIKKLIMFLTLFMMFNFYSFTPTYAFLWFNKSNTETTENKKDDKEINKKQKDIESKVNKANKKLEKKNEKNNKAQEKNKKAIEKSIKIQKSNKLSKEEKEKQLKKIYKEINDESNSPISKTLDKIGNVGGVVVGGFVGFLNGDTLAGAEGAAAGEAFNGIFNKAAEKFK